MPTNEKYLRHVVVEGYAPRTIDSSGTVELVLDADIDGAMILLDNGITVHGLKISADGTDKTGDANYNCPSILVWAGPGNTGTLAHNSVSVSDAKHKVRIVGASSNQSVTQDRLYRVVYSPGENQWVAFPMTDDAYTAANAAHWAGGVAPTTRKAAIDRLVAFDNLPAIQVVSLGAKP